MAPGQLDGEDPLGALGFTRDAKVLFDGARSRLTLLAQSACFATSAGGNLWAPIAGGLACDVLFIWYQRVALGRFFEEAGIEPGDATGKARDALVEKAQVTLLRRDLDRRRKKLAGRLMESVETSTAEGAKDFNVAMRATVKAVREARGIAEEDALTEVLDRIHRKFPPGDLAGMDEGESVARMREVLSEIEADIRGEAEEGPNAIGEGAGGGRRRVPTKTRRRRKLPKLPQREARRIRRAATNATRGGRRPIRRRPIRRSTRRRLRKLRKIRKLRKLPRLTPARSGRRR